MNYKEILENVKKHYTINEEEPGELISDFAHASKANITDVGRMTQIDEASCGGEDKGSDWVRVKFFPDHNVYIAVRGFYTSYEGAEFSDGWNCCSEVFPKEKIITVYE